MSSSACRELPGPRARSACRAERLGGRPSPPPLATAPCWPMQRDTTGAAPASLRAAGRRPKRPLPSGDRDSAKIARASRMRRARDLRSRHTGRSDMDGIKGSRQRSNSESAAAAPPPAAAPLTDTPRQTRCRRSRRHRRRRLAPRLRHRRPPSRGGVPLMARAPRSPAPRRRAAPPLAAAPLLATACPCCQSRRPHHRCHRLAPRRRRHRPPPCR